MTNGMFLERTRKINHRVKFVTVVGVKWAEGGRLGWDRCCLQKSRKSFCHLHTVTTFYTNINALNLFSVRIIWILHR